MKTPPNPKSAPLSLLGVHQWFICALLGQLGNVPAKQVQSEPIRTQSNPAKNIFLAPAPRERSFPNLFPRLIPIRVHSRPFAVQKLAICGSIIRTARIRSLLVLECLLVEFVLTRR